MSSYDFPPISLSGSAATVASSSTAPPSGSGRGGNNGGGSGLDAADSSGKTHLVWVNGRLCRGLVRGSGSSRICLEQNCGTSLHLRNKKTVPDEGLIMIKVPRKAQAFVQPSLPVGELPSGFDLDNLEDKVYSADVLRALLRAQVGRGNNPPSPRNLRFDEEVTELPLDEETFGSTPRGTGDNFAAAEARMKTPGKVKSEDRRATERAFRELGVDVGVLQGMSPMVNPSVEVDPSEVTGDSEGEDWNRAGYRIDLLGNAVVEIGDAHNNLVQRAKDILLEHDQRMEEAELMAQLLSSEIGEPGETFEGSAVWDAIVTVSDQNASRGGIGEEQVTNMLTGTLGQVQADIKMATKHTETLMRAELKLMDDKVAATIGNIYGNFKQFAQEVSDKIDRNAPPPASYPFFASGGGSASGPSDSVMERRVKQLEDVIDDLNVRVQREDRSSSNGFDPAGEVTFRLLLEEQAKKLGQLEQKIAGSRVFKGDDGSFSSQSDVEAMVRRTNLNRVGCYPDVFAIFILMVSAPRTGQEHATRLHASNRAHMRAGCAELIATFSHEAPPIFFSEKANATGSSVKLVPKTKGFGGNLSTYKVYDDNMNSMKASIDVMIEDLATALSADLDMKEEADRLAACMIRKAVMQAHRMQSLITNMHRAYTTACRYPDDEAWELVGRMVRLFFLHLKSLRARVMGIEDIGTDGAKAAIIWTMMESLCVSQEILTAGIQNHPVIMKEVVEFQLEHRVDATQLADVEGTVKALRLQLKEMSNVVTKVERANKDLADKLSKANQDIGNLKVELKRKADK